MNPVVELGKKTVTSIDTANGDVADGYQWAMNVNLKPKKQKFTIFQSIHRVTHYKMGSKSATDTERFTEMWHKPKSGVEKDSFRVPRWWRTPSQGRKITGHLEVKAKLWVVKGTVSFKSQGASPSKEGGKPWGEAHGVEKVLTPPHGHPYVERHFKLTWKNKGVTDADLEGGKEMKVVKNSAKVVKPPLSMF